MDLIDSNEVVCELIKKSEMLLIYFGSNACNVCVAIKPKVEELFKKYPKIKSIQVDVEKSVRISANYNIFTIPAILVFIEGKEVIREARYISIQDIDNKISRYYDLFFE